MAAALMVVLANVLAIHAQAKNKHDLGKPFGWATCTSLDGGCFNLCGGEGGQSVTLVSDGSDMAKSSQNCDEPMDAVSHSILAS